MGTSSYTILLLDYYGLSSHVDKIILESAGYTALLAHNVFNALEAVERHSQELSLIMTEFDMPDMNGYEFLLEVRKINPEIPLILSTTNYEISKKDVEKWGFQNFLIKPYNKKVLLDAVYRAGL